MSYDDWKTDATECDEEPCWRCKSAQKDVGNYCGDCAKGETMGELDLDKLERRAHHLRASCGPRELAVDGDVLLSLIAAARELAELKEAIVFDVRSTYARRSIGMSDADVFAKWLFGVKERGWTGKAE